MVGRISSAARAALDLRHNTTTTTCTRRFPELPVNTRSPSPLSPVHCAIATVFVALPKTLSKLGFAL